MKLQQPRNYDIGMFQFNLLGSPAGNSRAMTTSPPGHHWEATVALTTAAKLQKVQANNREMTSQKLNEEHEILRRFMAVVVSSAFWDSLNNFLAPAFSRWEAQSSKIFVILVLYALLPSSAFSLLWQTFADSRQMAVPCPCSVPDDSKGSRGLRNDNHTLRGPNWGLFLYQRVPH